MASVFCNLPNSTKQQQHFLDKKANTHVFIFAYHLHGCIHWSGTWWLPCRLHNSLLLTQVPTFSCQYINGTSQRRNTWAWDIRQDLLKMYPFVLALMWLQKHTKGITDSDFGRRLRTTLLRKQVKQRWLMEEDRTEADHMVEMARLASDTACHRDHSSLLCSPGHTGAAVPPPSHRLQLVAKAVMPTD